MLTRVGWTAVFLAVAVLAIGIALGYPELVIVGTTSAVVLAIGAVIALGPPGVSIGAWSWPATIVEGTSVPVRLKLTRARRLTPVLDVTIKVGDLTKSYRLGSVPKGVTHQLSWPLPPLARGVYSVARPVLRRSDPFGFVRVGRAIGTQTMLYVYPRTHDIRVIHGGGREEIFADPRRRTRAGHDDFYSLRDYSVGDDYRMIHWPSTAHHGRLVVREAESADETSHVVLLDTAGPYEDATFEDAVRIAASLCTAVIRSEAVGRLYTTDGRSLEMSPRHGERTAVLTLLATVKPTVGATDPPKPVVPTSGMDHAAIYVVTGRASPALLLFLATIARQAHTACLVQVTNPLLAPPVQSGVLNFAVGSSEEFADAWNRRTGR
jgi:uncharacterized protein (DUF58 family)